MSNPPCKNHPKREMQVCYSDEKRGLLDVMLCNHCYLAHLKHYYPQAVKVIAHVEERIKDGQL